MPPIFSQNFSVSQTPANPAYVIITDTSIPQNYAGYGIDKRIITIKDIYGNYIVPAGTTTNYIDWALLDNPKSLMILTQDTAVNIQVDWLDSANTVLYTLNNNYCFSQYNKQFLYYLIQLQAHTYNIIQDTNYWRNVGVFWANIIGAINAVEIGDDISASQACLNRATNMAQNQAYYF
jgi:hypothetical protein